MGLTVSGLSSPGMMSEVIVPLLALPGIKKTPPGKLLSLAQFLCRLYGSVDGNFSGFRGKICRVVRGKSSCHDEGGCLEQQQPCLLHLVKENWELIGISLKSDNNIIRLMKDVKEKFKSQQLHY